MDSQMHATCARRWASGGVFGINWVGALLCGWVICDSSLTFYVLPLCYRHVMLLLVRHGMRAVRSP